MRTTHRLRVATNAHQRGIRVHLKSMLDFDDADDVDEPLLQDEDDEDKASFLAELKQLAEQAQDLASA
jgi:hypothetical protein